MPMTNSVMPDLGTSAPVFALADVVSGAPITLDTFARDRALLVAFVACHCPFSQFIRNELARLAGDYAGRPLGIVAICASDTEQHPEDGPDGLRRLAQEAAWTFPVCFDPTQEVAKAFQAACTPDFFLFDRRRLAYRGRLDDSRPSVPPPVLTGRDLRDAIDAVLADRAPAMPQHPSMGCNIKWRRGQEPSYSLPGAGRENVTQYR